MSFISSLGISRSCANAHVTYPYKSGAPSTMDLLSDEIQALVSPISIMLPQAKSGKVRVIAASSAK